MEQQGTLIRKDAVCQEMGIGRSKFYQLCQDPDFPSLKIGRRVYVDRKKLNEWIARQIEQKAHVTD